MRSRSRQGLGTLAALAAAGSLLIACGSEETLTADEVVDGVNEQGVQLRLGEELVTDQEGQELYAVELEPAANLPGSGEERHAGGSLSVSEDSQGADSELSSCEASADLLCYRIANVVIVLEGGGIEAQQLGVAMERLSED